MRKITCLIDCVLDKMYTSYIYRKTRVLLANKFPSNFFANIK